MRYFLFRTNIREIVMKHIKKSFSFLLVIVLLMGFVGCTPQEEENSTNSSVQSSQSTDNVGVSDSSTKQEADFEDNCVLVKLHPSANFREYTAADFADVGCIELREPLPSNDRNSLRARYFILTLDKHSKQNVLSAIAILEQREDVYGASPSYGGEWWD